MIRHASQETRLPALKTEALLTAERTHASLSPRTQSYPHPALSQRERGKPSRRKTVTIGVRVNPDE